MVAASGPNRNLAGEAPSPSPYRLPLTTGTKRQTNEGVARQLAAFLANILAAREVTTPDELNRLARQLFAETVIDSRTVMTVKPRPELLPFFQSVKWCVGGSDGNRSRVLELFVPRRVVVPDFRTGAALAPRWPSRPDRSSPPRYRARARKLTAEQESTVRALAATSSLRSLATKFGVSHETARAVLNPAALIKRSWIQG